jgi:hypothetical protein
MLAKSAKTGAKDAKNTIIPAALSYFKILDALGEHLVLRVAWKRHASIDVIFL